MNMKRRDDEPPRSDDGGDKAEPARDAQGRWLPGHCPNPRGRPTKEVQKAKSMKPRAECYQGDIRIFANTEVDVISNGEKETMDRQTALLNKMYESAMKGKVSMQRYLHREFKGNDKRLAEARVRHERLLVEWFIDNPNLGKPDFEIPFEVEVEITQLESVLNHYFPENYPLRGLRKNNNDEDDDP